MHVIAVLAQKGGVGKTTLSVNLACAAELAGKDALLIDLDPQATACKWADRRNVESPIVLDAQPSRLPIAIDKARAGGVGLVVIDVPPRSEHALLEAAKAADIVLIPCSPQPYDLETLPQVKEILAIAGGKNASVVLNIVPAQGDRHIQAARYIQSLDLALCPHTIGRRKDFGDAGTLGQSAQEFQPREKAAQEILQVYNYTMSILEKGESREQKGRLGRRAG